MSLTWKFDYLTIISEHSKKPTSAGKLEVFINIAYVEGKKDNKTLALKN